jgi:hypothetical protein
MCGKFGDREGGAMTGDVELLDSIKIYLFLNIQGIQGLTYYEPVNGLMSRLFR